VGFIDIRVTSIDKNMTIIVELIDTVTKKAVLKDTFTAAGTKQYRVDQSRYELAVTVDKANGNSKYAISLAMPETAPVLFFDEDEVPLASFTGPPQIAAIGNNPIILHQGGTDYFEQGARAVDYDGEILSSEVEIIGAPDTTVPGTYTVLYRVTNHLGLTAETTREVRILEPDEFGLFEEEEVALTKWDVDDGQTFEDERIPLTGYADEPPYALILLLLGVGLLFIQRTKRNE